MSLPTCMFFHPPPPPPPPPTSPPPLPPPPRFSLSSPSLTLPPISPSPPLPPSVTGPPTLQARLTVVHRGLTIYYRPEVNARRL
ncbi:hypothetical protein E2C01_068966 [Portunus trituberculatus]|uniref:Uncharacterized protein n=1 Tax=Portunus trituberculatus TaxID=210409 RepID=A0A5B7HQ84_PORTR|nr:hypothetical protein [Portunus trituberculatus]